MTNQQKLEKLSKLFEENNLDIDIKYAFTQYLGDGKTKIKDLPDNANDLYDELQEQDLFRQEVIYFASAMEYLQEEDTSLTESLEIAQELGFKPKDLNSELLASLLKTRRAEEKFQELSEEIEEILSGK